MYKIQNYVPYYDISKVLNVNFYEAYRTYIHTLMAEKAILWI